MDGTPCYYGNAACATTFPALVHNTSQEGVGSQGTFSWEGLQASVDSMWASAIPGDCLLLPMQKECATDADSFLCRRGPLSSDFLADHFAVEEESPLIMRRLGPSDLQDVCPSLPGTGLPFGSPGAEESSVGKRTNWCRGGGNGFRVDGKPGHDSRHRCGRRGSGATRPPRISRRHIGRGAAHGGISG